MTGAGAPVAAVGRPPRIALLGGRGIPANYSGFDTLLEEVAIRLVEQHGMDVTVYCRRRYYPSRPRLVHGVRCVYLPALPGKGIESISHTCICVGHALFRRFDLVFVVDPANAPFCLPLKLRRFPVVFHTDGLGWKRSKWSRLARAYYKRVESLCAKTATALVTDSRAMQRYYTETWRASSTFLPYGAITRGGSNTSALQRLGLEPHQYWLVVTRIEPENNTDLIVAGYLAAQSRHPLIVVGHARYASDYSQQLFAMAGPQVRFVGGIYDAPALNGLYANCLAYLHGHEVGGTNPGLLRAMEAGACCAAVDVAFNVEVLEDTGVYFRKDANVIAAALQALERDPDRAKERGAAAQIRARCLYRWDAVAAGYAALFRSLVATGKRRDAVARVARDEFYFPKRFAEAATPTSSA